MDNENKNNNLNDLPKGDDSNTNPFHDDRGVKGENPNLPTFRNPPPPPPEDDGDSE